MSSRSTVIITVLLIVLSIVISALVYDRLPEPMASHWNTSNQVDGYISRIMGAYLMPVVAIMVGLLFLVIPKIDPLKANIVKFIGSYNAFIAVLVAFLAYVHVLTIVWNLGYDQFNMGTAMMPALGLIFVFAGLMMRKAKRNFFIGIRTPWTLSSDWVWNQTHRVGSVLFVVFGLLSMLGVFFPDYVLWFLLVPVLCATLFLAIYSYILYRKETQV